MACTIDCGPPEGERFMLSEDVAAFLAELRDAGDDGTALVRASTGWGGKLRRLSATVDPLAAGEEPYQPLYPEAPASDYQPWGLHGAADTQPAMSRLWREAPSPWLPWESPPGEGADPLTGTVVQALPAGQEDT